MQRVFESPLDLAVTDGDIGFVLVDVEDLRSLIKKLLKSALRMRKPSLSSGWE